MQAAHNPVSSSAELVQRLAEARAESDRLFDIVRRDALYERPIPDRHRIVFYLGHLEAFEGNLLRATIGGMPSFHPEFDRLFAFGIDPVGTELPSDRPEDWPALPEIYAYNQKLREQIDTRDVTDAQLLNVAIEHRLMHCETLAYMLHRLPLAEKLRPQGTAAAALSRGALKAAMVDVAGGPVVLGLSGNGADFGWDNEFEAHTVEVAAFAIDKYKVSNGQYLEFIEAGGYANPVFWTESGWRWRVAQNVSHPAFWRRGAGGWLYRGMFEETALPLEAPVYVSHAEASAYARWSGKQLPTEPQWQRAALGAQAQGNADFRYWDPTPVNAFAETRSASGAVEMIGNGWEWTSSVFAPFAGFKPFPFYPGYSANFFDGQHFVMKGGSPRTAACMLRPSFRNWFQPHYPYVYAGFRCVSQERTSP
ncbi:MAG: SUMF1/EgtB/PvdO family nonheme iron enzyme [Acidobacteriota bacterium]|nr:SUMF1/EgtB/PvdO family nonheme iron enzyme [Acidobacteriota bacterium]